MSIFLGATPGLLVVTDINRGKGKSGNCDTDGVYEKCEGQGFVRCMQNFGILS